VADEPVVVIKAQPEKAGNGVEGKTELIIGIVSDEVDSSQKLKSIAKGRSKLESE
jgi:hypothetical protein